MRLACALLVLVVVCAPLRSRSIVTSRGRTRGRRSLQLSLLEQLHLGSSSVTSNEPAEKEEEEEESLLDEFRELAERVAHRVQVSHESASSEETQQQQQEEDSAENEKDEDPVGIFDSIRKRLGTLGTASGHSVKFEEGQRPSAGRRTPQASWGAELQNSNEQLGNIGGSLRAALRHTQENKALTAAQLRAEIASYKSQLEEKLSKTSDPAPEVAFEGGLAVFFKDGEPANDGDNVTKWAEGDKHVIAVALKQQYETGPLVCVCSIACAGATGSLLGPVGETTCCRCLAEPISKVLPELSEGILEVEGDPELPTLGGDEKVAKLAAARDAARATLAAASTDDERAAAEAELADANAALGKVYEVATANSPTFDTTTVAGRRWEALLREKVPMGGTYATLGYGGDLALALGLGNPPPWNLSKTEAVTAGPGPAAECPNCTAVAAATGAATGGGAPPAPPAATGPSYVDEIAQLRKEQKLAAELKAEAEAALKALKEARQKARDEIGALRQNATEYRRCARLGATDGVTAVPETALEGYCLCGTKDYKCPAGFFCCEQGSCATAATAQTDQCFSSANKPTPPPPNATNATNATLPAAILVPTPNVTRVPNVTRPLNVTVPTPNVTQAPNVTYAPNVTVANATVPVPVNATVPVTANATAPVAPVSANVTTQVAPVPNNTVVLPVTDNSQQQVPPPPAKEMLVPGQGALRPGQRVPFGAVVYHNGKAFANITIISSGINASNASKAISQASAKRAAKLEAAIEKAAAERREKRRATLAKWLAEKDKASRKMVRGVVAEATRVLDSAEKTEKRLLGKAAASASSSVPILRKPTEDIMDAVQDDSEDAASVEEIQKALADRAEHLDASNNKIAAQVEVLGSDDALETAAAKTGSSASVVAESDKKGANDLHFDELQQLIQNNAVAAARIAGSAAQARLKAREAMSAKATTYLDTLANYDHLPVVTNSTPVGYLG